MKCQKIPFWIIFPLLFPLFAFSQNLPIQTTWGDTTLTEKLVRVLPDGEELFVIGHVGPDIIYQRLGTNHEVLFEATYSYDDTDDVELYPNDAIITEDGEIVIVGEIFHRSSENLSGLLYKIDKAGHKKWDIVFDNSGENEADIVNEALRSIEQTSDGGFISTGFTNNPTQDAENNQAFGNNMLIQKMSPLGLSEWTYIIETEGNAVGVDAKETPDGGFVATCDKQKEDGTYNVYVVKLDEAGEFEWELDVENPNNGGCKDMIVKENGTIVIVGEMAINKHPEFDIYVVHINPNGELIHQYSIPNKADKVDAGFSIQAYGEAHYVIAGYGYNEVSDQTDIILVHTDGYEHVFDRRFYGNDGYDIGLDISLSPKENRFLIAGGSFHQGSMQFILIEDEILPIPLATEMPAKVMDGLVHYDPLSSNIYLNLPSTMNGLVDYELFNHVGQLVATDYIFMQTGKVSLSFPAQLLTNGIYYIKVKDQAGRVFVGSFVR